VSRRSIDEYVDYYPLLARALLEFGDAPESIVAFLCSEYALEPDQAQAAIVLAGHLEMTEREDGRRRHSSAVRAATRSRESSPRR
jgi:hypothetical protein